MKNNFFIIFFSLFIGAKVFGESVLIESKIINLDKNKETSIFKNEVVITTQDNSKITSEYAEYDRVNGVIKLKENIKAIDNKNNIIESENAIYYENTKVFKSFGPTKIITSDQYIIEGSDITFDNQKKFITSSNKALVTDLDNNKIYLDNFEYIVENNIFKSVGYVKIEDKLNNTYEFSQVYIDTKKKEILGTDIKAYLNHEDFKVDKKNKPRIFANNVKINKEKSSFKKSVFTMCDYREKDKCPPWSVKAKEMLHDSKNKTIFYKNAVVKVYDVPIFFFPKLSHPDPTVKRRSGFLIPTFSDTKNLGSGISVPYFWALNDDKNLTLTSKLYVRENPLLLGEYHQAFRNADFITDFGYTEGYKKTSATKTSGDKSHFFSKFSKNFTGDDNSKNTLSLSVQNVSNDKYLKLYKIKSNLVDYSSDTLENSFDFTRETNDSFFGINASMYETIKEDYNDKYEYIYPQITYDKNLLSNDFLTIDYQNNFKVHKYDTNKFTNFLTNDLNWSLREKKYNSGLSTKILGNFKNINYEAKNVDLYKKDTTSELYGSIGYLSELEFQKNNQGSLHSLKPKLLFRYSPGSMRKENDGSRLIPINAFSLDRLNNINNFETGLSSTFGFDYMIDNGNNELNFSAAQIISEKENKKMPTKSSLDEKLSDFVGSADYKVNENLNLNYNFALDQNYKELNYNEFGAAINLNSFNFDFNYLQENKHIGDQEYFETKINFLNTSNSQFSFETKRNLVSNSSEFYNLSYEYLNDCLRAGLVYRREFYNDSELEPENSLMFKITLTPFGNINSPSFSQ